MDRNAWLPWIIGEACLFAGFSVSLILQHTTKQTAEQRSALAKNKENDSDISSGTEGTNTKKRMIAGMKAMRSIGIIITHNTQVLLLLSLAFICEIGDESLPLMVLLYISKRFGWSFAKVTSSSLLPLEKI